jgi:hypothetical protein
MILSLTKIGENALTATDPNDFIFNSNYNTFKIILEATKSITLIASTSNQNFTQAHNLDFTPLVSGFCKVDGESQVYPPNGLGILVASSKIWIGNGVKFNFIGSDDTNIIFNFDNTNGTNKDVYIRYFCLEQI